MRRAYHAAGGNVVDVQGLTDLFADDGVINLGHAGQECGASRQESYRGEQLGQFLLGYSKPFPDVHRELQRVNVLGDSVAVELSIRGHLPRAAGDPWPRLPADGAKVDDRLAGSP